MSVDWNETVRQLTDVTVATATTGGWGIRSANLLPVGWAHVAVFDANKEVTDWFGPVLNETSELITVEVWGSPMTFLKDHTLITRGRA